MFARSEKGKSQPSPPSFPLARAVLGGPSIASPTGLGGASVERWPGRGARWLSERPLGPCPVGTVPARQVPPRLECRERPPACAPVLVRPVLSCDGSRCASLSCPPAAAMAASSARLTVLAMTALALLLLLCLGPGMSAAPGRQGGRWVMG